MGKISKEKKYKTRDGREVRIYATDTRDGEYPVHGAVLERDGRWHSDVWTEDGFYHFYKLPSGFNLIEVTEPELVKGKWYTNDNEIDITTFRFNGDYDAAGYPKGYGVGISERWLKDGHTGWNLGETIREATEEEVEQALTRAALKRGFVKGTRFRSVATGSEFFSTGEFLFEYGMLYRKIESHVAEGVIMQDGKWAEVLEKPEQREDPKESLMDALGGLAEAVNRLRKDFNSYRKCQCGSKVLRPHICHCQE